MKILIQNEADLNLKNSKTVIYFYKNLKVSVIRLITTKIVKSGMVDGEQCVKVQWLLRADVIGKLKDDNFLPQFLQSFLWFLTIEIRHKG